MPTLANTKNVTGCNLLSIQMKQSHWLLCIAKNCDWSRKITPLSNLTRESLLVEWKLTAKSELNCEIYISWRECCNSQVSFCHQSSPVSRKAWTLRSILQELKKYSRKTCGCCQPSGHLIRVLNERSVFNGRNFCLLWLVAYQDQFCAWFSLTRQPTETARVFFLNHFLKETSLSLSFLLLEPVQCLGKTFLYLIFCPVT